MTDSKARDTEALIQQWIMAFCEMPVLIDPELMRVVLKSHSNAGSRP
ncbi:hypothetical protein [Brevundimonas subvibrioides]|nr:hypothetical protein [Brevundimonas subvibrioides]